MISAWLWQLLRSQWKGSRPEPSPGYTALLPVPSDLPVFLKIALATLKSQDSTGLAEILVIPDRPSAVFAKAFEAINKPSTAPPIRLVTLRPMDRFITARINSPHTNHWLQLINGLEAVTTRHVLLHDADLFITDEDFLAKQYAELVRSGAACLGVNPVWDPWYREHQLAHVTATWELMFDAGWARSFKPWMHRGHHGVVAGKSHEFDTMLLPQALTEPSRILRRERNFGFVHFNYVICTYRWFREHERKASSPYEDDHWRLLLIRLLVDAFESTETDADIPSLTELRQALTGASDRVDYRGEAARHNYPQFREKLRQLLEAGILQPRQIESLSRAIAPFDEAVHPSHQASLS
jgi:hypothetical protein